ncbi:MAG: hypothetical protein COW84_04935 [Gammaproteobacteria bacterium CG22_combo_CG10-13_8_21_14_all_40_8]|nr:MAG: hypothetical protein COW84_04935 [Gammaproteobacteria bacterium CG22_combo_CG10-13_8_21_14_all_40_8]
MLFSPRLQNPQFMLKRLHIIQHVSYEGPSLIRQWANTAGFLITYTECWSQPRFPETEAVDGLILLGGPMNVGEWAQFPWLLDEVDCIKRFVEADKPVLGICLGGQLLAYVLGAAVTQMTQSEIGIWPVQVHDEAKNLKWVSGRDEFYSAHWHNYQFQIPEGARLLFSSKACAAQGFIYQRHAIGLQCHLEADALWLRRLYARDGVDLAASSTVQNLEQMESYLLELKETLPVLEKILDYLFLL